MPELHLRPMTADEYRGWYREAVASYADDLRRNVRFSPEAAERNAADALGNLLPDGLATPDHWLMVGEDADGARVGHLWFARRTTPGGEIAYLFDIAVVESARGRGYGRGLMERLEEEVAALGLGRIELNVFGHNEVARRLYEDLGYVEMSRQLFKELGAA